MTKYRSKKIIKPSPTFQAKLLLQEHKHELYKMNKQVQNKGPTSALPTCKMKQTPTNYNVDTRPTPNHQTINELNQFDIDGSSFPIQGKECMVSNVLNSIITQTYVSYTDANAQ